MSFLFLFIPIAFVLFLHLIYFPLFPTERSEVAVSYRAAGRSRYLLNRCVYSPAFFQGKCDSSDCKGVVSDSRSIKMESICFRRNPLFTPFNFNFTYLLTDLTLFKKINVFQLFEEKCAFMCACIHTLFYIYIC